MNEESYCVYLLTQLYSYQSIVLFFFFFQAEDGIRDVAVTGVQTCALPILQARMLRSTAHEVASAEASGTLAEVAEHRYGLLVTFRRDGTPVATPVWAAVAGQRVFLRAERNSGKVKRLRNNPRALLAPCTS